MDSFLPLITIVTPTMNREATILDAVQSVRAQTYRNIQHIIVDGGSTDRTLEILEPFTRLEVISEPDKGIYDALNKGIRLSSGDIIVLLNSDDLLPPNALEAVVECFRTHPEADIVSGNSVLFSMEGEGQVHVIREYKEHEDRQLGLEGVLLGNPNLNARCFKRHVIDKEGLFDTRFLTGSDREYLVRLVCAGINNIELNQTLYLYRSHSGSATFNPQGSGRLERMQEYMRIAEHVLSEYEFTSKDKKTINKWYMRCSHKAFLVAIRSGEVFRAGCLAFRGVCESLSWPVELLRMLYRKSY